ncbi:winged helix-turn-helix domain-containing protein [Serratia marcescens]|uniref:winged helix-turn-helix domain-containing protein n=1 Tax=Serratia marcescens TaxID=615 RepID=UPI00332C33EE
MIFNINNRVLFNESEGTLEQVGNDKNRVTLLKPTSRLLSLFIRHNNHLILREQLLNEVWVEHGLKASNNNLNNYVSGLRKSLAYFGEESLIITYPRQGFKFYAHEIINIGDSSDINDIDNAIDDAKERSLAHEIKTGLLHSLPRLLAIVAISLTLFSFLSPYEKNKFYVQGRYENCKIYGMNPAKKDLDTIKLTIQQRGLNCQTQADIYYYDNVHSENTQDSTELLTFCPQKKNSPCVNSYVTIKQS